MFRYNPRKCHESLPKIVSQLFEEVGHRHHKLFLVVHLVYDPDKETMFKVHLVRILRSNLNRSVIYFPWVQAGKRKLISASKPTCGSVLLIQFEDYTGPI